MSNEIFIDGNADAIQLRVQENTTQTNPLQTWEDSSATVLAQVDENGQLLVDGHQDQVQVRVQAHSAQTNALQTWEDSTGNALAQIAGDGRLEVGDLDLGTPDALIEANRDITLPSSAPQRGVQSRGLIRGAISNAIVWAAHELELLGTGGISGLHIALRAKISQKNTGDADLAELRAGDFEAINEAGSSLKPVGKLTGVQGTVTNEQGAYLDEAVGVEVQINDGNTPAQITDVYGLRVADLPAGSGRTYALHTGEGSAHFGDDLEMKVFTNAPTENPPSGFIKMYTKLDAGTPKLYSKDSGGTERELSWGGGGAASDAQYVTLAAHAGLSQERVLTPGNGLSLTDGGAGSNVTLDVNVDNSTLEIVTDTLQAKKDSAQWNANKLQGRNVAATAPGNGETLLWADANQQWEPGPIRAIHQALFYFPGTALVGASSLRIYNATGQTKTISKVFVYGNGASGLVVDIHKDGVTIFTNQAHRVTLSGDTGYSTDIDVPSWAANSYLTCEIDTAAGSDVVVHVVYS